MALPGHCEEGATSVFCRTRPWAVGEEIVVLGPMY